MTIRVATALTDAIQESRVVQALSELPDVVIVRRCRDIVELRAIAHASHVDAVVVDSDLRGLDRDVVSALAGLGVCVVAVADDDTDWWGVGSGSVVARDLIGLSEALRHPNAADVLLGTAEPPVGHPAGQIVGVWGPQGAPGRTTVTLELAASWCRRGDDVMVIDADTLGPSVAQLLGLLDDTSGLAAAARMAAGRALEPADLVGLAVGVPAGPRVLTGLPAPERWTELRAAALDEVLRCSRDVARWTLVDVGGVLEGDDLEWADPDRPQRFAAARRAMAAADVVLCVGRADPVGLARLLREIPKVQAQAPTADVHVVLNDGQSSSEQRQAGDLVKDALGLTPLRLPHEPKHIQKAQIRGALVHDVAPTSAFVAAVDEIAAMLAQRHSSYHRLHDRATRAHRGLLRRPHRRHRSRDAGVV
jgi:MinD-like ATPase involved in chromosome partitioning or flagellar assembly